MKSIKHIALAAFMTIGAFGAVTFTSCNKDDDTACPVGMEGKDCATEMREKFVGTWTAQDQETNGTAVPAYNAIITKNSTAVTKLNIGGFSDEYFVENVVVNAQTATFDIPSQDPDGDGFQVEGSGSLNTTTNVITVEYTITQPITNATKSYTGIWTK